jgi:hypothetical protein
MDWFSSMDFFTEAAPAVATTEAAETTLESSMASFPSGQTASWGLVNYVELTPSRKGRSLSFLTGLCIHLSSFKVYIETQGLVKSDLSITTALPRPRDPSQQCSMAWAVLSAVPITLDVTEGWHGFLRSQSQPARWQHLAEQGWVQVPQKAVCRARNQCPICELFLP